MAENISNDKDSLADLKEFFENKKPTFLVRGEFTKSLKAAYQRMIDEQQERLNKPHKQQNN